MFSRFSRRRRGPKRALAARIVLCSALIAGGLGGGARAADPTASGFEVTIADLRFILDQIKIAERHAGGEDLLQILSDVNNDGPPDAPLTGAHLQPFGLRTVTGEFNNLLPNQQDFGRADRVFPRLTTPVFRPADTFDVDGPGPGGPVATSYTQTSGTVADAAPRIISNLIVDQTDGNPAAVAAAAQTPGSAVVATNSFSGKDPFFIPNVAPDAGLSAPFNAWFTFFGQFFDHGLDLVNKGGSGTVIVPLQPDDPLYNPASPTNFLILTRATNQPGPDGTLGTADDIHEHVNQTSPFVDQNQTYTSHPSHQVFLREFEPNGAGQPVATGRMLDGADGGLATWADVKAQASSLLGITLTDQDALNVPLLVTDFYGKFTPGANGRPQLVAGQKTGHAFLDDIAHHAVPVGDLDHNPATPPTALAPDADLVAGPNDGLAGTYDNELLDAHHITGDGRGNENIALTSVHHVFHSEHNRLVGDIRQTLEENTAPDAAAFLAEWQLAANTWNGERLFQAAKFVTEMQYQHLVFEEFARKVQPQVNVFGGFDSQVNPSIVAEFAHTVYRFGHSMLTENLPRITKEGAVDNSLGLIEGFLNPLEFRDSGANPQERAGRIIRGLTREVGNEIDEFVTEALRNNLLGLPLDLPTINMTRGRDTGIPPLNAARRTFYQATGDAALRPYASWDDFRYSMRHPESLVNFVAAYGTHPTITAATTVADKRAAAALLVNGDGATIGPDAAFLNAPAAESGVDTIDFWVGGLAEKQMVFGGLLGSTFNFVFETQMERLQDGDRLYYLGRLAGQNLLTQLEENTFAELIERNTDLGDADGDHLPADVFSRPDIRFELEFNGNDPSTPEDESLLLARSPDGTTYRFGGAEHVLIGGTNAADKIYSSEGDDSIWGDEGNDRIEGGDGNDRIDGGTGDDIITDLHGEDVLKGGDGNDAIHAGSDIDLILGGTGKDFVVAGSDLKETFGGTGDDFINAGNGLDIVFGDQGSDWIEGGDQADLMQGDHGAPFQDSDAPGHDVMIGQGGNDDYDSEGGDDIMVGDPGVERHEGMLGFDWTTHKGDPLAADADLLRLGLLPPDIEDLRDRFDLVESLSGWEKDDVLRGDNRIAPEFAGHELRPENFSLINGLAALVPGDDTTPFTGGNILIGGRGSDRMEGRGGDDLLDGDAWLNICLRDTRVTNRCEDTMSRYQAEVFAGQINPGDLAIHREILNDATGTDRAVFSGNRSEYTITRQGDLLIVQHVGGTAADGTDTLRNIEFLVFADGEVANADATTPAPPAPTTATATPNPADFGTRNVGDSRTRRVRVQNTHATNDLVVTNVAISGANAADFAVTTDGCTGIPVPAGRRCDIQVTFTPSAAGARNAVMRITFNGGLLDVGLSGTGRGAATPPPPPPPGPPAPPAPPAPPILGPGGVLGGLLGGLFGI